MISHNIIEISSSNLLSNINEFRKILSPQTKIIAVIKANAYGHGIKEVAKVIENNIDFFQVDDINELKELREVSQKKTFVFGYVMEKDLEQLIDMNGVPGIYSLRQIELLNQIGARRSRKVPVHLCIDSKLGRDGILASELEDFIKNLANFNNIEIEGFYSHFANIEDTNDRSHAENQILAFQNAERIMRKYGYDNAISHISATSGILEYDQYTNKHYLVRLGIGLYGLWPSKELAEKHYKDITLKPVISVKSILAQIKTLPPNHTIGYGLTYITEKEMKIGIIPFGYSDGISRSLSNKGFVLIQGKKCKILGRISMNMMVVDLSEVQNAQLEEEVVILGKQGSEEIAAEDIATLAGTINYEILAQINPKIVRIIN
mgnify:CR=1 FL=1